MPGFGNIRKLARDATSAAERGRDASKERLSSVGADQLSQRVQDTAEKTVNAASQSTDQLAQQVRSASEKAVDTAKSSTAVSQEFLDEANSRVAGLAEQTLELSNEAIDRIFPECSAPMYIMPTGSGQEDYALMFQLDEIVENLNSGFFVRPKIEAWSSGYQDYDLERLGEKLKREFTSQFSLVREQRLQSVAELEASSQKISDERASDFGASGMAMLTSVGLAAALGTGVMVLGPSLPAVVLLLFALGFGGKALSLVDDMRKELARSGSSKRELNRNIRSKIEELDEVDSKSETFQRAVRNIEIRTHPKLQELHRLICDIEDVPFQSGDVMPMHDASDIAPYLRHPEFLRKLPDHYHSLLTVI